MIGTFAAVLIFTMLKEAYEDYGRYKSDKEVNNKGCKVWDYYKQEFLPKKWMDINVGDLLRIDEDSEIPADILLIKSNDAKGIAFVNTMNLDGEVIKYFLFID